jgi:hypothetical protein
MNRVLSWPHTPIVPELLEALKAQRHKTVVNDRGMIRVDLAQGPVEMKFCDAQHQLLAGTEVYVWWKGGGFVCAPAAELDADERAAQEIAERFREVRLQLAQARREREERLAALGLRPARTMVQPASPLLM